MKHFILPALFLFLFAPAKAQPAIHEVVIFPPKPGETRYYYVPFDVPKTTQSLTVKYSYDKKGGANVLDMGLFDSLNSGARNGVTGFRGWSGGRRETVFISRATASNGYLHGDIPGGKWQVILGLYKIVPEGVKVTVTISLNEIDAAALTEKNTENMKTFNFPKFARTAPPKSNGFTWFRGDLHTHTFHSDGNWTLRSILDYSLTNNLDFVAITEHNTTSHHHELEELRKSFPKLLVLTGEEITTYGGHINVWGLPKGKLIDFRVTPGNAAQLDDALKPVREMRIPASINHPTAICGGCSWTYGDDWAGMDSVEIWNGNWDGQEEAALKKWDTLLVAGRRITAIGSSDSHSPPSEQNNYGTNLSIGGPTTFIGANKLNQKEILSAIFSRRVFITNQPDRTISLSARKVTIGGEATVPQGKKIAFTITAENFPEGSKLKLISDGKLLGDHIVNSKTFSLSPEFEFAANTYFRIEIRDISNKMLAMSNPIFIKTKTNN